MLDQSQGKEVTISSRARNGAAKSSTSWKPLKRSMKRIPAKKNRPRPDKEEKECVLKVAGLPTAIHSVLSTVDED
jgi:hypothetical protein